MEYNRLKVWIGSILAILLVAPVASAFGVSTPYWSDNPLVLEPGQSREVVLSLQNMLGGEDVIMQAEILSGSEIATLKSGVTYNVGFGDSDVPVALRVSVPSDAAIGEEYDVEITFKEVKEDAGGFIGLSAAVATTIPVHVGTEPSTEIEAPTPEEPQPDYLFISLVFLALAAIIVVYLYKKR